jgi:hypothetical protein
MRPLIAAEPMFRAPSPEMVDELNGASAACKTIAVENNAAKRMSLEHRIS